MNKKIELIEATGDDMDIISRMELEEVLGGWNCGSYSVTETEKII